MALVTYTDKDTRFGIAKQSAWGTAVADNGAFTELDCEPFDINMDVKVQRAERAHASRHMLDADIAANELGSAPSLTIKGNAGAEDLDLLLYAFFQNVSEGASTPFAKTFAFQSDGLFPDLTVNAGAVFTICARQPQSAYSWKVKDCICRKLKLNAKMGEHVKYEAEFIGRGAVTTNSDPSGTWTRPAIEWFNWFKWVRATCNFGSGAQTLHLSEFDIDMSQDVAIVGQDAANSTFQAFSVSNRGGKFNILTLKDAQGQSIIANYRAGTGVTLNLGQGNASAGTVDGDLDLSFTGKLIDNPEIVYQNPLSVRLGGELTASSGTVSPITIILANATDRTW